MKNKIKLKKYFINSLFIMLFFIVIIIFVKSYEYQCLTKINNEKIMMIISEVTNKYPLVSEKEINDIINSKNGKINEEFFKKYNIDILKDNIVIENNNIYQKFIIIDFFICLLLVTSLFVNFYIYNKERDKELKKINKYLEEINNKNYSLEINELSEDELSILKNELYKITVLLRENADNSLKDKKELKKSLEDISHQLKTPLTSILIMLDNLEDNNLDAKVREEFLRDIKRNIMNINSLVQNILKLSKFDANTINFVKDNVNVFELIRESVTNVSTLCDLKNIKIEINGDKNIMAILDHYWEVEALTNILKNCVEYSFNDSSIIINLEDNNAYTKITVKDNGKGINANDLPHIFERFYKGYNSSNESIGIGLSLAKTIIEKDNGSIDVTSFKDSTIFEIKFYKF